MIPRHVIEAFSFVEAAYPNWTPTEDTPMTWAVVLADVTAPDLHKAVLRHIRKNKFPPAPAELRELSRPNDDMPGPQEAWGEVLRALPLHHKEPEWSHPLIAGAVRASGGFRMLGMQTEETRPSNRARFIRTYEELRDRKQSQDEGEQVEALLDGSTPHLDRLLGSPADNDGPVPLFGSSAPDDDRGFPPRSADTRDNNRTESESDQGGEPG